MTRTLREEYGAGPAVGLKADPGLTPCSIFSPLHACSPDLVSNSYSSKTAVTCFPTDGMITFGYHIPFPFVFH